mgnify:CR=1 FL=1
MIKSLTEEQRKLVEENHNLIFKFANKKNISIDEYYDILAIGMCNAASIFDSNKGSFSTIAFHCMENELNLYWRHTNRMCAVPDGMVVSYDAHRNTEDSKVEDSFLSILSDDSFTHEIAIGDTMFLILIDMLTDKEKNIALLLISGYTQEEIAEKMNCSRQNIGNYIKHIRKKIFDYLGDE